MGKEYNKNVPPITVDNGIKETVNVSVSIDLSKVVDIDEVDYSVEMQISITLRWTEIRATYQNLKNDRSLNALTQDDLKLLWLRNSQGRTGEWGHERVEWNGRC